MTFYDRTPGILPKYTFLARILLHSRRKSDLQRIPDRNGSCSLGRHLVSCSCRSLMNMVYVDNLIIDYNRVIHASNSIDSPFLRKIWWIDTDLLGGIPWVVFFTRISGYLHELDSDWVSLLILDIFQEIEREEWRKGMPDVESGVLKVINQPIVWHSSWRAANWDHTSCNLLSSLIKKEYILFLM